MRTITLPEQAERAIRAEGERAYPNECIGLLLGHLRGDDHEVIRAVPVSNIEAKPDFFRWDEAEYLRIDKEARAEKLDIIGLFHSHPNHPAIPSKTDFEFAAPWGDTYAWIIVSVKEGKSDTLRSWCVDPGLGKVGEFREQKIETKGS